MTGGIHYGDEVTQHGDHNVGMIKNQGSTDPHVLWQEMIDSIVAMKGHAPAPDRQLIDESMATISLGARADKGALRSALRNIAGVAMVIGEVGVPVVEAIRKVMSAFGL